MGRIATGAVALICTLAFAGSAVAAASQSKLTFEGVTFSDGTTGTIEAASKTTGNGDTFTTCVYFDADRQFLGEFGSADFASTEAAAVEQFCLEHFADRAS